ncbi:MAG: hypothetical protein ACI97K_001032 [Glaciecola sp.]|jgi:uncharacterized protein (DUF342 family)
MKGLSLSLDTKTRQLNATVDPLLIDDVLQAEDLEAYIDTSDYSQLFILSDGISALCKAVNAARASDSIEEKIEVIAEARDAEAQVNISNDNMSAELVILSAYSGSTPSFEDILALLNQHDVHKGISKKRVNSLLFEASESKSGKEHKDIVAKGLPPRNGKPSYIKPLFPNALERILQPQEVGNNKVNMRNLGDILCVPVSVAVAQRVAPTNGREGFTVSDEPLVAKKGDWVNIKLGTNTQISEADENFVIATVAGLPKFENSVMVIEDTFQTKGVNVGTGNIEYDGAVIVNGDVTESMVVIAKGDITINGFVESATIRAGGDIIITEGAMGRMNEEDCRLHAHGSIFVQHGQGLDIIAKKNLNVRKQLAYSRVNCAGKVTIGESDKPMGSIFASTIQSGSTIYAGSVGAISGSALNIDFSENVNLLSKRHEAVTVMLKQLRENSFDHEVKLRELNSKHVPSALANELNKISSVIEAEKHLLVWLETIETELRLAKDDFNKNAKVVAYKELFHGVSIKMNQRSWRSEKDYLKSVISLNDGKWQCNPIVR